MKVCDEEWVCGVARISLWPSKPETRVQIPADPYTIVFKPVLYPSILGRPFKYSGKGFNNIKLPE